MERLKRTEKRRPYKPGGFNRSMLRHKKYDEAAKRADNELLTHQVNEPSLAFFPSNPESELDVEENIIFEPRMEEATIYKGRKADVAKKRGDKINGILEDPQGFPKSKSDMHFIRRHVKRISKFIKTLKNKGKLHPEAESIIKG